MIKRLNNPMPKPNKQREVKNNHALEQGKSQQEELNSIQLEWLFSSRSTSPADSLIEHQE